MLQNSVANQDEVKNIRISHRQKILNAKARIDTSSPLFKIGTFLKPSSLLKDKGIIKTIVKENSELMEKINKIQRTTGVVIDYNENACIDRTKIHDIRKELLLTRKANLVLGERILKTKHLINIRNTLDKNERNAITPMTVEHLRQKLLQPKVYLDLGVKHVRPLGRLVIDLHTTVLPGFVLNFIKCLMPKKGTSSSIQFIRIFPDLYMEGLLPTNSISYAKDMKLNEQICSGLQHDTPGVLSINPKLGDPPLFTISFKPIPLLNEKRIIFGKIIKGLDVLCAIQDYGTKNGKPKQEIVISASGLIK